MAAASEKKSPSIIYCKPAGAAIQGGKQHQEDSFCTWTHENVVVGGVFDGHGGYNGKLASETCTEHLIQWLNDNKEVCGNWQGNDWKSKIVPLFCSMQTAIRDKFLYDGPTKEKIPDRVVDLQDPHGVIRSPAGDPIHGGTTGSVVIMFKTEEGQWCLVCANVGDSTGLLCWRRRKKCEFLTVDHGPESQDEYKRINDLDSEKFPTKLLFVYDKTNQYRKYECPKVFLPDGTRDQQYVRSPWSFGLHPTNVRYEPAVYAVTPQHVSKDATCIAMTRSLGDFYAQQFGLSWRPSINIRLLAAGSSTVFIPDFDEESNREKKEAEKKEEKHTTEGKEDDDELDFTIIIGSDGIWDCWKYDDFTEHLNDTLNKTEEDIEATVTLLTEESIKRAKSNFGVKHYDDAALVGWRVKV